jgi:transcription elongation factor Elf1
MRRAIREGCFMGNPPRGYVLKRTMDNKATLEKNEDSNIILKIFKEFSKGLCSAEELRKKYYASLKISKQSFLNMLRNPVYIGKLKLKEWKKEPEEIVEGLHESIIDELTFERVQTILSKNKKIKIKPNNPALPLRRLLVCNSCGKKLSGSLSTSHTKKKYAYYHCQKPCGERFSAIIANKRFETFLTEFQLKSEMKNLLTEVLKQQKKDNNKVSENRLKQIQIDINKYLKRLEDAQDKYVDKEIDEKLFKNVYARYQNKVSELKCEEATLKSLNKSVFRDVNSAVLLLENLSDFYKKINYQLKQKLVSSVFPENLIFDGKKYRTTKPNKLVELIFLLGKDLQSTKRKKVSQKAHQSLKAPPTRLYTNFLLEEARSFNLLYNEILEDINHPQLN